MLLLYILITSFLLQFILPWWIIGPVAFAFASWKASGAWQAFKAGFFAILLLWALTALFKSIPNQHLLANRVGQMFMLPPGPYNWVIMIGLTALIGAIPAGLAALAGFYFRQAITRKRS